MADLFSIALVELLSQEGCRGLVDTNIKSLQSVGTVCRYHDYVYVIVFTKVFVPWLVNVSNIASAG